eukprot:2479509-Pyramimonas_sp.AAC.1
MIRRFEESITLNTAGFSSRALGSVCVACPNFRGGNLEALVMPETPAVISVGERCMDRGFSAVWPAGQRPYLDVHCRTSPGTRGGSQAAD